MQVFGFHLSDRVFVQAADICQYMSTFQVRKKNFVIKRLTTFMPSMPENRPTGFSGMENFIETFDVDAEDLF